MSPSAKTRSLILSLGLSLAVLAGTGATAQETVPVEEPGIRIQGRDGPAPATPTPNLLGALLDNREEMRKFIQSIATYSRSIRGSFYVIAHDALDLIIKQDVQDETKISPARTFMQAVDGILVDGVFYGGSIMNVATTPEKQAFMLDRIALAKRYGLNVFAMDFANTPATVDAAFRAQRDNGLVGTVVHKRRDELTELPPYPVRPFNENPKNVLSVGDIRNLAYISDPAAFGRQDEFALKVHGTNFDAIIVDPIHGRTPLSRQAVETLKYKKLGARRLVFARLDIGTAASYHFYWRPEWREGSPFWISAPFPTNPDRYFVEYWRPAWQQIVSGSPDSIIYALVVQGYDGVVLEGMRSYRFFEGTEELEAEFAPLLLEAPK